MGLSSRIFALCLAGCAIAIGSSARATEHVVQPGQTLAKIAKRYRVELDALCTANDLKRSAKLQPGVRLTIPSDNDRSDGGLPKSAATSGRDSRQATIGSKKHEADHRSATHANNYAQYLARPTRRGWTHIMTYHGDWQGQLVAKSGKLQPKAVVALSKLLSWPRSDLAMDRRLLTLLAQISDAFGGRTLRVVSGYRTTSYSSESKHPLGRACDFHVLGVPNTALRDYVRTFDSVGVGYYPNSTFVHLDVRDHDAYWIDYAGPGEPPRSTPYRVSKSNDEPPMNAARTTATMKGPDESNTDPEATADAQSRQDEGHDNPSGQAATRDATTTKSNVTASSRPEAPHLEVAAEPESTSIPRAEHNSTSSAL